MHRLTSGDDLERICYPQPISIVAYSDLQKMDTLPTLPMMLLYEMAKNTGHWCVVFNSVDEDGRPCIEFFDSYGLMPDKELNWIKKGGFKKSSGQDKTQLLRLLLRTGANICYSNDAVQDISTSAENITTCGLHCCLRIALPHIDAKTYTDALKKCARSKNKTTDEFVSALFTSEKQSYRI